MSFRVKYYLRNYYASNGKNIAYVRLNSGSTFNWCHSV